MSMKRLVREIHDTPVNVVIALAGGGARAVARLLEVPGASRTVLEVVVPYSEPAMTDWLGGPLEQACSSHAARAMAMAAFLRAGRFGEPDAPLAGVSCTASLATDRPKRGPHRVHLAIQTAARTTVQSLALEKGARDRGGEERLVARLLLNTVAEACGLERRIGIELVEGERLDESTVIAPEPWQRLLLGKVEKLLHGGPPDGAEGPPKAILSGAFNPIHFGHRRMAEIAREILKLPVELELPIINADKPPVDYCDLEHRLERIGPGQPVWLTRAAKFVHKSRLFPGATFVVGIDTLRRLVDPRFYNDDPAACRAALEQIAKRGCRFLVFGRDVGDGFVTLGDLELPAPLSSICQEVPPAEFREDVSSTEIRKRGGA